MILALFIVFAALSIAIVILGYFSGDTPLVPVGLFFLFLLSIPILNGQLEYQTGEEKNVTFTYTGAQLDSQHETTLYTYAKWNDTISHWIGYGLAVGSFIGFIISLIIVTTTRREENA